MQERSANTVNMDNDTETEDVTAPQASRGRNNSKLANKLVRSHAMREEASPPRDVLIAAAAAAASAADDAQHMPTVQRASTSTPNTLSPPIQHRIRSPPDLVCGGDGVPARVSSGGGNPVLVLSPSVSPSDLHQTLTSTNINTSSTSTTSHNIQCSYHHHHHHQQQQQQACNHHTNTAICNLGQSRASPTNNGGGGATSPSLSTSSVHRCCSPQQQQMLLTVDYVSGESGDDRGDGGTSHKVAKLNSQNLDLCTNKQRNPTATILKKSSQQQTKAPKCDCNMNNNYQSSLVSECHQQQQQHSNGSTSCADVVQQLSHYSNGGGGGGGLGLHGNHNHQLTVQRGNRAKLRQQSSSQSYGSFDGSHSSLSLSASPCLSRDNSSEQYTDTTGVDLDTFIPETLNRNAKDRALMLRIEEELVSLAKDQTRTHYKFPPMSSYQRMLVHRCAAYFGMDHNIESSGKCVVVNRTKVTRIPAIPFKEHLRTDTCLPASSYSNNGSATGSTTSLINNIDTDQQQQQQQYQQSKMRRSILKRGDNNGGSMDEITAGGGRNRDMMMLLSASGNGVDKRSKSFEEREEEYAKVRRRIFNPLIDHEHRGGSQDEFRWSDVHWPSTDSDMSTRNKLHPIEHHHAHRCRPLGRLQKVQSEEKGEDTLRPCVAKSYSFGGYGGCFTRGDSIMSTHSAGPRLLTKQDSSSSITYHPHHHHHHHHRQLSPSSSGYKTQSSQRSTESVTPSPTSTPYLPSTSSLTSQRQDSTNTNVSSVSSSNTSCGGEQSAILLDSAVGGPQMVFWAVTDVDSVPPGSVIINPATGMAIRNDDGSVYRYDPENPPAGMAAGGKGAGSAVGGAIEKQISYTENKMLLSEPLMEEPAFCSNEMVAVQTQSPKRQQVHGGKPPLSPSHYRNQHHQHHQMEQQPQDEQLPYQQQQQEMVELVECHQGSDSAQMLPSPTHDSPQRRRRNSPFKKQENFAQASVDKPIMVSTYTSTSSPSSLPYSPPPTLAIVTQASVTPRPSRPSSVVPQQHTLNNNIGQHMQSVARYTQSQQQQHQVMMPDQQQQTAYLMGQPSVYSETVMYGSGTGGPGGAIVGGMQPPPQPCFVYGYGVPTPGFNPVPMENNLAEVGMNIGVGGYYIADGAGAASTFTYQPWMPNQPAAISYFTAPAPPTGAQPPTRGMVPPPGTNTRFSVPMHAQTSSYLAPSPYAPHHPTTNYITCPAAAAAAHLASATHQQPPSELIPLYSPVPPPGNNQPHVVYAPHPSAMAGLQSVAPVAGQLYPTAVYNGGNVPYTPPPQQGASLLAPAFQHQPPQQQYYGANSATSTPTGGHHVSAFTYPTGAPTPPSTMSNCGGVITPIPMIGLPGQGQGIVHGMGQMSLSADGKGRNSTSVHLDRRNSMQRMRVPTPSGIAGQPMSAGGGVRNFHQPSLQGGGGGCSSQSSTEPSSPATTVVPPYRLPHTSGTDTPPVLPAHVLMGGGPQHFLPIHQQQQQQGCSSGMVIRPINAMHSSPPIMMSRSSRSPTPAGSDISLVGDRPKFPNLPAAFAGVYHPTGVPFMFPADVRFGIRSQSSPFRQMSPHQRLPQQTFGTDRGLRNRKPRGNKQYLLPNGRPNM